MFFNSGDSAPPHLAYWLAVPGNLCATRALMAARCCQPELLITIVELRLRRPCLPLAAAAAMCSYKVVALSKVPTPSGTKTIFGWSTQDHCETTTLTQAGESNNLRTAAMRFGDEHMPGPQLTVLLSIS